MLQSDITLESSFIFAGHGSLARIFETADHVVYMVAVLKIGNGESVVRQVFVCVTTII